MKKFFNGGFAAILAVLCIGLSMSSFAQTVLEVPTGDSSGSYFRFVTEAASACKSDGYVVTPKVSSGSSANLDALLSNDAGVSIVQMDVAELNRNQRDLTSLRVLLPLFPEQAHFITRANFGKKKVATVGGVALSIGKFSMSGEEIILKTVADLQGMTVAAAGGSLVTGKMLAHPSVGNLPMNLVEVKSSAEAVDGVLKGDYDAAILVTAQPSGVLTNLKGRMAELKLLPVPAELLARLKMIYPNQDSLTYPTLGSGVPTFQIMSSMLVTNYSATSPMGKALASFRKCILDNAEDIASTPKTHPAWRYIAFNKNANIGAWQIWGGPDAAKPSAKPAGKPVVKKPA